MHAPQPPRDALVRFEGITKRFGATRAVDALDLAIASGEFVTLLGPSGCGKSTTLRMLGGFEIPDEGRILLSGEDVTRLPPNRRDVNMVFQDYALFPHMSVAKNIAFGLELKGRTRGEIGARVSELLGFLQLDDLAERAPDQLSGGQRQRVALARALAPDPKLLLLDEPLGALDAKLRADLQSELKDIQTRTGKTFLFVTHDQDEALTMSDRIVVMNGGRIEQDGTPEDLYLRPKNRFVAEFVGETNLFAGAVTAVNGRAVTLDVAGRQVAASVPEGVPAPTPGASATASLRLENVICRPAPFEGSLEGHVVASVFKGSRTLLHVEIPGASAPVKAFVAAEEGAALRSGNAHVGWRPEHLTLLAD